MQQMKDKTKLKQEIVLKQFVELTVNIIQNGMNKIDQFRKNNQQAKLNGRFKNSLVTNSAQHYLLSIDQYVKVQAIYKKLLNFKRISSQNQNFISKLVQIQSHQQEINQCFAYIQHCKQQIGSWNYYQHYESDTKSKCLKYLDQINNPLNNQVKFLNFMTILMQRMKQNQELKKELRYYSVQSAASFKKKQDELQKVIKNKERQTKELSVQVLAGQGEINELQIQLKECKDNLKKSCQRLSLEQRQKQILNEKLSKKDQALTKMKIQLEQKMSQIDQNEKKIKTLLNDLSTKNDQHDNKITNLRHQISTLKNLLTQNESNSNQLNQQHSRVKLILDEVYDSLQRKINKKQLKLHEIANEIQNYRTPVGMKLITSVIIHGNDNQRIQIVDSIEKFSKKSIKKTELLCRYPETKSMFHQLPKEGNNFPFILLYKTKNGKAFGSYSEGILNSTFILSFIPKQEVQQLDVKFYIPKKPSQKISSLMIQGKYLQYGAGQLKISTIDLSTITANSNVMGEKYYDLDWKEVMNENEESKVPLVEVELHRVEFQ